MQRLAPFVRILLVLLLLHPPSVFALNRDVSVFIRSITVNDDCDEITAGDWFLGMEISHPERAIRGSEPESFIFPSPVSTMDIDTGETKALGLGLRLREVPISSPIFLSVSALDCDSNVVSLPGAFLVPFFPIIPEGGIGLEPYIGDIFTETDCDGEEEITELSGDHDLPGFIFEKVASSTWNANGAISLSSSLRVPSHQFGACFDVNISEPGGDFIASGAYSGIFTFSASPIKSDGSLLTPVFLPMF